MARMSYLLLAGSALALVAAAPMSGSALAQGSPTPASAANTPALWSVETQSGATFTTVIVCADDAVRQSFARALPEVSGQPCQMVGRGPVQKDELFATRCRIGSYLFTVHSVSSGDPTHDFGVDTVIDTDTPTTRRFETKLHFRKIDSSCPRGWDVGDAGAPGAGAVTNSLSGVRHQLPAPIPTSKPGA